MQFCNLKFNILHKEQLFERKENEIKCIATVNAQFIVLGNTNKRYMDYINKNYATFDGTVPFKKALKLNPELANAEILRGSEIVYDFAAYAKENNLRTFYLGGYEDSNKAAVETIRKKYGIDIEGYSPNYEPYPVSKDFTEKCFERLEKFKPDIVFVGFGAPKQEYFIEDNIERLKNIGVKYVVGCGGTFEFVSGKIKRAPSWISKIGLEGVYRLFQEFGIARIKRLIYSFRFYKYVNHQPDFKNSDSIYI